MKRLLLLFVCVLILSACQNEDAGKDRRLVAAEHMLEAITEGNIRKMKQVYVEGAKPTPKDLLKLKAEWGISSLSYDDFRLEEASIHVFHAIYIDEKKEQEKALAFRIKEDPNRGSLIDFVGVVDRGSK
ncbi:hypothetical protein [Bacillus sp. NPDC077027]|uniref:hypothetical protein n=1 Tax=Bacillus sp. NPDC077027 TaxID=3390548 RepID=UPI003D016D1E